MSAVLVVNQPKTIQFRTPSFKAHMTKDDFMVIYSAPYLNLQTLDVDEKTFFCIFIPHICAFVSIFGALISLPPFPG